MSDRLLYRARRAVVPFLLIALSTSAAAGQWPQWGGPNRDFKIEATGLADKWPEGGPKRLWSRDLGDGYAGIVADGGAIYTMHRRGEEDVVIALDAATGKTRWEFAYPAPVHKDQKLDFGKGPNSTPLLVGGRLITIGFTGKMTGLDARTGSMVWSVDLVKQYGAKVHEFGYSISPIVYKGAVVVPIGGEQAGLVAVSPAEGRLLWKSPAYDVSYASPIVIGLDGEDQLVFMSSTEVIGVNPSSGELRWRHPHANRWKNNCFDPVWCPGNLLFITSHTDAGSRMLRLSREGGKTKVTEVWKDSKLKIFHSNAIRLGDHLYGSSGDEAPTFFSAFDARTGKVAWKQRGLPKANAVHADGKLFLLDEDGKLTLARVSPEKFELLGQVQVTEKVSWTAPTLAGRTLFIRDRKKLLAVDVGRAS